MRDLGFGRFVDDVDVDVDIDVVVGVLGEGEEVEVEVEVGVSSLALASSGGLSDWIDCDCGGGRLSGTVGNSDAAEHILSLDTTLARPKSQILSEQSSFSRMFAGFKSRWITELEWM